MRTLLLTGLLGCGVAAAPQAPVPKPNTPPIGRVVPPVVEVVRPIRGDSMMIVDVGDVLYLTSRSASQGSVEVPHDAQKLELSARSAMTSVLVAIDRDMSFDRVARIAQRLQDSGRCMVPVVVDGAGTLGTLGENECAELIKPDDEHVEISLFVTPEAYWVGLSRVNEFSHIERSGQQGLGLVKLLGVLTDHKKSVFFIDRGTIELTADDADSYADIAVAGSIATTAGWRTLRIVPKSRAQAVPTL